MLEGLYEGVDLRLYDDGGLPRYDLVLAPGADLADVRVRLEGADGVSLTPEGALRMETALGPVEQRGLLAYQEDAFGRREEVESVFEVGADGTLGFRAEGADPARSLVIDPLLWATFLGGTSDDYATALALGPDGAATVAGSTDGAGFPATAGAYDQSFNGGSADVFVARLTPDGSALAYATFLGGTGYDYATALALGADGAATVAGRTDGSGFPATAAPTTRASTAASTRSSRGSRPTGAPSPTRPSSAGRPTTTPPPSPSGPTAPPPSPGTPTARASPRRPAPTTPASTASTATATPTRSSRGSRPTGAPSPTRPSSGGRSATTPPPSPSGPTAPPPSPGTLVARTSPRRPAPTTRASTAAPPTSSSRGSRPTGAPSPTRPSSGGRSTTPPPPSPSGPTAPPPSPGTPPARASPRRPAPTTRLQRRLRRRLRRAAHARRERPRLLDLPRGDSYRLRMDPRPRP